MTTQKCPCPYCYFQSVGVAQEAVDFVGQVDAKRKALDFIHSAFRQADPQRRQDGRSENTIAILLSEWGLGKTQLLKHLRTAINNSSGVSSLLRDEYDVAFQPGSRMGDLTLETLANEICREAPEDAEIIGQQIDILRDRRGVAFRIDALKFHDRVLGESGNLLVPLFNMLLSRCKIRHKVTADNLSEATDLILEALKVDRVFIFFDELEALRTIETVSFRFDRFFRDFAIRVKSLIDDNLPRDVSICLATVPSVWEALTRQFEELGALRSRAGAAFIELAPLDLERAHRFILSRCPSADSSPFTDGTIRTALEASGRNPRNLNQLCFELQPLVKEVPIAQHAAMLDKLRDIAAPLAGFTYDDRALHDFIDDATLHLDEGAHAAHILQVLAGGLSEYTPEDVCTILGETDVHRVEAVLDTLAARRLRGVHTVIKLYRLDRERVLMGHKSLSDQKKYLVAESFLQPSDVRIDRQRLLVHDLEYERELVAPLEVRYLDRRSPACFLPTIGNGGIEELCALWNLGEAPAQALARTLRVVAPTANSPLTYRLSLAARERVFPRQSPKEPPFEWVDEIYWRETFAVMHDPTRPSSEKYGALLQGLRLAGQAYGAQCIPIDDLAFLWVLERPHDAVARYNDPKPMRALMHYINEVSDFETPAFRQRIEQSQATFVLAISTTHLTGRPYTLPVEQGRPQVEVVYRELDTRQEFKLQLLSRLSQEAGGASWHDSDKMAISREVLGTELFGNVVEMWMDAATETGYLLTSWSVPHDMRDDTLARAIREVCSTIPIQPVTFEGLARQLRLLGVRETPDEKLIDLLERSGQLVREAGDRLRLQLLPAQKRLIDLQARLPRHRGEETADYLRRICDLFWKQADVNPERELARHLVVVEELGCFDLAQDMDSLIQRIEQKLAAVTAEDEYRGTINEYSYNARVGQLGAKGADRLRREFDYFRGQYRLNEIAVLRDRIDPDQLTPSVVRHQMNEIELRLQEILATGEGHYRSGFDAVRRAKEKLEDAHSRLAGESGDIRIADLVSELQTDRDDSWQRVTMAHREGQIDDERRGVRSAVAILGELEQKLLRLFERQAEAQQRVEQYKNLHAEVLSKAVNLSLYAGLQQQITPIIQKLERRQAPPQMQQHFRAAFSQQGLDAGLQRIDAALQGLTEIIKELETKERHVNDLRVIGELIEQINRSEDTISGYLEPVSVIAWGKEYRPSFVENRARDLLKTAQGARKNLATLQTAYSGQPGEAIILNEAQTFADSLPEVLTQLQKLEQQVSSIVAAQIDVYEPRLRQIIDKTLDTEKWVKDTARQLEEQLRVQLDRRLTREFKSPSYELFEQALNTTTSWLQHRLDELKAVIQELLRFGEIDETLKGYEQTLRRLLRQQTIRIWGEEYIINLIDSRVQPLRQRLRDALKARQSFRNRQSTPEQRREIVATLEGICVELSTEREDLEQSISAIRETLDTKVQSQNVPYRVAYEQLVQRNIWPDAALKAADACIHRQLHYSLGVVLGHTESQKVLDAIEELVTTAVQPAIQIVKSMYAFTEWIAQEPLALDTYMGTPFEPIARQLIADRETLRGQASTVESTQTLAELALKVQSLLDSGTSDMLSVATIRDRTNALRYGSEEKAAAFVRGTSNILDALHRATLIDSDQYAKFCASVEVLSSSTKSYRHLIEAIDALNIDIRTHANAHLRNLQIPSGQDPSLILEIIHSIYEGERLSLRTALDMDHATGGLLILWLVQQGVIEGQLTLAGGSS